MTETAYPSENIKHSTQQDHLVQRGSEFIPPSLPSSSRLLLGISGISLAGYGLIKRDLAGFLLFGIGAGAAIRAITNIDTSRLFALVLHPTVRVHRQVRLNAPLEVVFQFWNNFSNFPRFMSYVQSVELNERHGFTWKVMGPGGVPIQWDIGVSALIPNQLISWKSIPGAFIMNSGTVSLKSIHHDKGTQLDIILTYSPPAGLLGYEIIKGLGFDPRNLIDQDLKKMKKLIEHQGRQPRVA
jgi:uncharacterized membrane protein